MSRENKRESGVKCSQPSSVFQMCGFKKSRLKELNCEFLTSESVQSSALSFQGVDDVHCGDSLPFSVFGVCHGISDDIFQKHFQDSSGFFVDKSRDTFDTTSARQSTDSGFGDTLDVISKDFSMTFGASLSKSFSSFTTSRHLDLFVCYSTANETKRRRYYYYVKIGVICRIE
jgi:hypothetical protein